MAVFQCECGLTKPLSDRHIGRLIVCPGCHATSYVLRDPLPVVHVPPARRTSPFNTAVEVTCGVIAALVVIVGGLAFIAYCILAGSSQG